MICNHNWSEETHEGVPSRFCHVCNEWEVELELDALEAELTSTKAAVIDAALIHAKPIQERDELQAKLDAELPAMWREDLASLNECLDRVGRERDTLREEVARLNTLLLSATGENQKRAEREARALEDWRELRAENDCLKAIRKFDVEYARLDTMWQELVRERDAAVAKATAHERDWYEAKSEFGTAAAKLREKVRTLESALTAETRVALDYQNQRDELHAQLAFLRDEYGVNADDGTLTRDALEQKIQVLIHERRQLRARLVECRAWAGRCPYPNSPAFDKLMAVRELADDTLEEVKP